MYYTADRRPIVSTPIFWMPETINTKLFCKVTRNDANGWGAMLDFVIGKTLSGGGSGGSEVEDRIVDLELKKNATYEPTNGIECVMSPEYNKWYICFRYYASSVYTYVHYLKIDYR